MVLCLVLLQQNVSRSHSNIYCVIYGFILPYYTSPMYSHFTSLFQDVSSCDWVNAVSSVSAVGEVAGIWLPEMVYSYRRLKGFTTRRFVSVLAVILGP